MCPCPSSAIRHVAVALSGGVDSAVAAVLLLRRGFRVTAIYMRNWDHREEGVSDCPGSRDLVDARWIAERLAVPLHVVDFARQYWTDVFTGLLEGYRCGRTPVADVRCNRVIKFGALLEHAMQRLNVDAIATGHYARTSQGDFLDRLDDQKVDPLKDQTYFLSTLRAESLRRVMFPLGSLTKPRVRAIARESRLHQIAEKRESMGICFVGKRRRFAHFLDQYLDPSPGLFRDLDTDQVLGEHDGVHHFTLGKRVRLPPEGCQSATRFYVASIDASTQTIQLCRGSHHPALFAVEWLMKEPLWLSPISPLHSSHQLELRCQRQHPVVSCSVSRVFDNSSPTLFVQSQTPLRAVAAGQTCAFYRGNRCLGGGEVIRVLRTLASSD